MNEVKEKRSSLTKAMTMGQQALGNINKRIARFTQEVDAKRIDVDTAAAKLDKAKIAKDEAAHQQKDLKLSIRRFLP